MSLTSSDQRCNGTFVPNREDSSDFKLGCDVSAIVEQMREEERDHAFSTFGEVYIKYREVVLEWMMDVCDYFNLHPTTTHAAVAYLDRLQPNEKFSRFEWQMLAICCILISGKTLTEYGIFRPFKTNTVLSIPVLTAKYNESEEDVPDLATLEDITQQPISNETVLSYELWALKRMGWKLGARTPMAFLTLYFASGVVFPSDKCEDFSVLLSSHWETQNSLNSFDRVSEYKGKSGRSSGTLSNDSSLMLADSFEGLVKKHMLALSALCLLDAQFKGIKASMIAASILYMVRRNLRVTPVWSQQLVELTAYEASALRETIEKIDRASRGVTGAGAGALSKSDSSLAANNNEDNFECVVSDDEQFGPESDEEIDEDKENAKTSSTPTQVNRQPTTRTPMSAIQSAQPLESFVTSSSSVQQAVFSQRLFSQMGKENVPPSIKNYTSPTSIQDALSSPAGGYTSYNDACRAAEETDIDDCAQAMLRMVNLNSNGNAVNEV